MTTTIKFDDLSNKQEKYIAESYNEALNSNMLHRHGCVAVSNGNIIATGHNTNRTKLGKRIVCSFHSEVTVLHRLLRGQQYDSKSHIQRKEGKGACHQS